MRLGRAGSPQGQDKDSESDCCSATSKVTSGLHVPSSEWFFFLTLVVIHLLTICFSDGSEGKESTCSVEYLGSVPGLGRPPEGGHGNPLQYSRLENRHGQRIREGYSPWGGKESDMIAIKHSRVQGFQYYAEYKWQRWASLSCSWSYTKSFQASSLNVIDVHGGLYTYDLYFFAIVSSYF